VQRSAERASHRVLHELEDRADDDVLEWLAETYFEASE
jgi:hypothetical protein